MGRWGQRVTMCGLYVALAVLVVAPLAVWEPVRVAGGSMEPALYPGDIVLVRRGAAAREGRMVLVREPGRTAVLHRVVRASGGGRWVLRGDANPIEDLNAVDDRFIAGAVDRVLPAGALLARWRSASAYAKLTAQQNSTRR